MSGNPTGAKPRHTTWAEAIRLVQGATPAQVAELLRVAGGAPELEAAVARMPQNLAFKILTAIRVAVAVVCEPSPGLLAWLADRDEGKVPDRILHAHGVRIWFDERPMNLNTTGGTTLEGEAEERPALPAATTHQQSAP